MKRLFIVLAIAYGSVGLVAIVGGTQEVGLFGAIINVAAYLASEIDALATTKGQ